MLSDKINIMTKAWEEHSKSLQYKESLFCVNEGELLPFVVADLRDSLGAGSKSFEYAVQRIPPINVLQKIISKLSQIYNNPPTREVVDGTDQDQMLLDEYVVKMEMDSQLDVSNEFYNLTKVSFVMPTYNPETEALTLKALLPHQFLPFGWDITDRTRITAVMTYQGEHNGRKLFYGYTDDEFIIFNEDGQIFPNETEGVNIFGRIPGVYIRKSRSLLYPKDDTDMLPMTILIPTMLADLNHASMFSSFSIMYGIDIDEEERKYAPNAFWHLKSDPDNDKKPEIGTIKPEADIDSTINLIVSEFSMWLNSKGIRPGSVGTLTAENSVSGISKIVDEMDTFEDRNKQALVYRSAEERDLWPLIMHAMHPIWVNQGLKTNKLFSPNARVAVQFPAQEALQSRASVVENLRAEIDAGFMSRERAIRTLNPGLTGEEIAEILDEINRAVVVEVSNGVAEDQN